MPTFITQFQRFFYNNFCHHFIYYIYLTTFSLQKSYIILPSGIILNMLYIKIHTHIEYSINSIENSETICSTIILDVNNSIDISYSHIKTSESYVTIGETTVITYIDTEKTSNEHIMISECYDTIGESDPIGYMATPEISYHNIKTSESYKAIGDTDNRCLYRCHHRRAL